MRQQASDLVRRAESEERVTITVAGPQNRRLRLVFNISSRS